MNASLLVIAGSETTASLLSGAFYLLGTNRDALDKVVREVRSAFNSEEEIDLISVNRLDYMMACLKESLRQYPPVTQGMPRVVPKGGHNIAGNWISEDVSSPSILYGPARMILIKLHANDGALLDLCFCLADCIKL